MSEELDAQLHEGAHSPIQVSGNVAFDWNPRVACRTLEGTAFILLDSRMVSLNDVGTVIWDFFEGGATLSEVVSEVVDQFETTPEVAEADAREFVEQLVERRMLLPVAPPP